MATIMRIYFINFYLGKHWYVSWRVWVVVVDVPLPLVCDWLFDEEVPIEVPTLALGLIPENPADALVDTELELLEPYDLLDEEELVVLVEVVTV